MKKLLFIVSTSILAGLLPALADANGVVCQITQPLRSLIFLGGSSSFSAICFNNTKNRNYTDFHPISLDQSGIDAVTTSCADEKLPVGGSCTITGAFTPVSATNNTFTLGLHYGGTDYPRYTSLEFSTRVRGITFQTTGGPAGGDISAAVKIPVTSTTPTAYVLGVNNDFAQSDIYYFNGTNFLATQFPLSTQTQTSFTLTNIFAADAVSNLYVGTTTTGSATSGNGVSLFNFLADTWTATPFNSASMGNVISLAVNSLNMAFAVTQNAVDSHTEVWEFDPVGNQWVTTNFPFSLAGNLSAFSPNNVPTFLVPDLAGRLYGLTAGTPADIWQFTPDPVIPGAGSWVSTQFAVTTGAVPASIFPATTANIYAGGSIGSTYDVWTADPTTFAWTSTNFQTQTGAFAPPYSSFLVDTAGNVDTTGITGSGRINAWQLATGTWNDLGFSLVTDSVSMSLQAVDATNQLYVNSIDIANFAEIWIYNPAIPVWTNQNFPSMTNQSLVLLMALATAADSSINVFALLQNGLYELNAGIWNENNTGLNALTTRYVINRNGALSTLNARQNSTLPNGECSTDPQYSQAWSDFAINDGFIDVFQHPSSSAWSSTDFPAQTSASYVFTPLVSVNNDLYALSISQTGGLYNIWHYLNDWVPTAFPLLAGSVYYCAQGALTPDSHSNLYVINHNGSYGVQRFILTTATWSDVSTGLSGGVIKQLAADGHDDLYSILVNDVFHFNHVTQTWASTNFNSIINGNPQHLLVDGHNNVYAVAGQDINTDIWKYTAASQSWSASSLGFPAAQAGTLFRNLVADNFENLYARTINGTVNSVWQYVALTNSWRNMALVAGYPTGAVINELSSDNKGNIYLSTSVGLYVYSGVRWVLLNNNNVTRFLLNDLDVYYLVTNDSGVLQGSFL